MTGIKRLSPRQSRKVNTLVKKECCNCENGNCILLDDGDTCVCPQLISYSLLCKWFRIAVLPLDKLLFAELYHTDDMRKCIVLSLIHISRVEWCACFVSWCYGQMGLSEPRFAACQSQGIPWFTSHGPVSYTHLDVYKRQGRYQKGTFPE